MWLAIKLIMNSMIKRVLGVFQWMWDHPKQTAIIAALAATAIGVHIWDKKQCEEKIAKIEEDVKKAEDARKKRIEERIAQVEDDAKKKADAAEAAKIAAEQKASTILREYNKMMADKRAKEVEYKAELARLKAEGKGDSQEARDLEGQLAAMKCGTSISEKSVATINGLREAYQ